MRNSQFDGIAARSSFFLKLSCFKGLFQNIFPAIHDVISGPVACFVVTKSSVTPFQYIRLGSSVSYLANAFEPDKGNLPGFVEPLSLEPACWFDLVELTSMTDPKNMVSFLSSGGVKSSLKPIFRLFSTVSN